MKQKFEEWLSIRTAKNPGRVVLSVILLFNILFFLFAALVISNFGMAGTEKMNFFEAAFSTIAMILDAGCVQFVIEDIGQAGVAISVFCLIVVLVGMISFTGAVIGYLTNYISEFVANANAGKRRLRLKDHIVLLNWNTRASEIINDLLYCPDRQIVVVMVEKGKAEIEKEVEERLQDTVSRENKELRESLNKEKKSLLERRRLYRRGRMKNNITLIVREGDVFSSKQLHDISLEHARTVIILGSDDRNTAGRPDKSEQPRGNALTIKTLMQVADITADAESDDNQRIIVEITDVWTEQLVQKIIETKQDAKKNHIVPVKVNEILGQILSQFSLMPELNLAYRELFSNKGATFFPKQINEKEDEIEFVTRYMKTHKHAIPLTVITEGDKTYGFYSAASEKDIMTPSLVEESDFRVDLNHDFHIEDKNVVIIGHNSKSVDIMNGFNSFRNEWNYRDGVHEILRVIVIDDEENLKRMNWYRDFPFVTETIAGTVYDTEIITETVNRFSLSHEEDTSILILSDDTVPNDEIDANVLANLVFAQDNVRKRQESTPEFDPESIDIIAEIIDPKHHDVVSTYSVRNVVISNRYVSKMITQIGEKDALFNFYTDILSYDIDNTQVYESKEIYAKKATRFFRTLPPPCRADELIRAVYRASTDPGLPPMQRNPTVVLGYVKHGGEMVLFEGDQTKINVEIGEKDRIIVFSNH